MHMPEIVGLNPSGANLFKKAFIVNIPNIQIIYLTLSNLHESI